MTNAYNLMQNLSNEARRVIAIAVIVENGFTRSLNDARTAVAGSAEKEGKAEALAFLEADDDNGIYYADRCGVTPMDENDLIEVAERVSGQDRTFTAEEAEDFVRNSLDLDAQAVCFSLGEALYVSNWADFEGYEDEE